ncbi:M28 family metallopeptidase [Hephaestia sp. GCM10023244]|uniref:M28 family metallopeptidase n=1 Tax=unclassified Hephaestia TaxID=2631281 RepID=UPI00207787C5|nr:M28 family metallopeptidase [Hephaestia sp. MAHUQ-44]MCM8731072.1 M28 family metallopeptidase [Hephaestia sp. MAHUQ-44]
MHRSILALLALAVATPVAAQSDPVLSVETVKTVTETLSSDAYEGRAPTTPAEARTTDYIVARFKAAGLQPGNHGSWFQDVPLVEITARDVAPITITGGKVPLAFAYRTDMVIATYRVVPRITVANSDIVFVGYGINAPERGWNDYAGVDVKGKTVVILVNDPDWETAGNDGPFDGRAMTYYGRWTYKYEEAARQGAAAAIIVHQTAPASYGWNVVQSSWTGPQLELAAEGDHMDQSQAIGWVQLDAAKRLFASAGKDFDALAEAAKHKGFKAVPLGLKASFAFDNSIRRQASKNVIGVLPGTLRPQETVFYTAHWDHLGRCDAVDGDDICNGALDNASGVAGMIAIAEAQAKAGPAARTLAFMAVTAEESGLLGSRYYAEHPIYPLGLTVGGVNMDVLNVNGRSRNFVVTGYGKSDLDDLVLPLAEAQGRRVEPEAHPERGGYYRSDHFSFAKLGVPMLDAGSGADLVEGGVAAGEAASKDYGEHRYHQPADEYDANWDWSGAIDDLTIYYRLGRGLADGNSWPEWKPDAEFRTIREAARAAVQ